MNFKENSLVYKNYFYTLLLFMVSLANYGLMYYANIQLAQHMAIGDFDDYSVAISITTLLSSFSGFGLEKYALRRIPLYIEQKKWRRLRGFFRFSISMILGFSGILALISVYLLDVISEWRNAGVHSAIALYIMFLPVITLSLFLVEVVTSLGRQVLAIIIYRFLLPVIFVVFILENLQYQHALSAEQGVLYLGAAWGIVLIMLLLLSSLFLPKAYREVKQSIYLTTRWLSRSTPLLASSLLMSLMVSSGTIILELLYPSQAVVGSYAIAMQSSSFISLIGTSTNRYYLPMFVVFIERHDTQNLYHLKQSRFNIVLFIILLFFLLLLIFGRQLLDLFGHSFNHEWLALLIAAVGASFSTLFADAPYYLQFMGHNKMVIRRMTVAVLFMLILSFPLSYWFSATGAAIAYAVPTAILFINLRQLASKKLHVFFKAT